MTGSIIKPVVLKMPFVIMWSVFQNQVTIEHSSSIRDFAIVLYVLLGGNKRKFGTGQSSFHLSIET